MNDLFTAVEPDGSLRDKSKLPKLKRERAAKRRRAWELYHATGDTTGLVEAGLILPEDK